MSELAFLFEEIVCGLGQELGPYKLASVRPEAPPFPLQPALAHPDIKSPMYNHHKNSRILRVRSKTLYLIFCDNLLCNCVFSS